MTAAPGRPGVPDEGAAAGAVGIGAHVRGDDPLAEARALGAACLQMFLGDPQSWRRPPPRADADALRGSPLPVYVHAPYLVNVASPNNRIRLPSRKIVAQTLEGAAAIGAAGVIVHAGHAEDGFARGLVRWRKALEELEQPVPLLIENTAGGAHAMASSTATVSELWAALDGLPAAFCFDTCHAHAAGEDPVEMAGRLRERTAGIVLVHANGSRDAAGSGRDRHANLAGSVLPADLVVEAIRAAGAAVVICETPPEGLAADLAFLRARL
ncbi:MAG TPA: deoxyribonuclease IV [Gemmatimonadota bacterium]